MDNWTANDGFNFFYTFVGSSSLLFCLGRIQGWRRWKGTTQYYLNVKMKVVKILVTSSKQVSWDSDCDYPGKKQSLAKKNENCYFLFFHSQVTILGTIRLWVLNVVNCVSTILIASISLGALAFVTWKIDTIKKSFFMDLSVVLSRIEWRTEQNWP